MSGSPMPARPLDLYPILRAAAPETIDWKNHDEYGMRYCAGQYRAYRQRGGGEGLSYDFTGASNLIELRDKVQGTFMYRVRKDVLKLPPLLEDILVVADNRTPEVKKFDSVVVKKFSVEDLIKGRLEEKFQVENLHLATYRKMLGQLKASHAVDWIQHTLDETPDEAFLVFCAHPETGEEINRLLYKRLKFNYPLITGQMQVDDRFKIVQRFQNGNPENESERGLIGNWQSLGLGFNATRATRVLHVEPDWLDFNNIQAHDRAHRWGQSETVYVQYLCYANSSDKQVLDVVLKRRKMSQPRNRTLCSSYARLPPASHNFFFQFGQGYTKSFFPNSVDHYDAVDMPQQKSRYEENQEHKWVNIHGDLKIPGTRNGGNASRVSSCGLSTKPPIRCRCFSSWSNFSF